jgi:hypothetical protein
MIYKLAHSRRAELCKSLCPLFANAAYTRYGGVRTRLNFSHFSTYFPLLLSITK